MAGTPTAFDPNKFNIGPGQLWVVDVPAAGGTLTLAANGTPDFTAHPNAKHLGHTDAGATFKAGGGQPTKIYADEIQAPVYLAPGGDGTATLSATLLQTADVDLLVLLTPGQGTKYTATGKTGISGGQVPQVYLSVALIYPTVADPTKFEVIHLYKCQNTSGIEKAIQRKGIAKTPVNFEGVAITSRATADQTYMNWMQT